MQGWRVQSWSRTEDHLKQRQKQRDSSVLNMMTYEVCPHIGIHSFRGLAWAVHAMSARQLSGDLCSSQFATRPMS
eukprot:1754735-Amphidinium_carterae.2